MSGALGMQTIDVGAGLVDYPVERVSYSPQSHAADPVVEARKEIFERVNRNLPVTNQRHWDATVDSADRAAQWCLADGRHINAILVDKLDDVRNRSMYEHRVNPTVEGVIATHKNDVVGRDGPTLQIDSGDSSWDDEAESALKNLWWQSADTTGDMSFGDVLKDLIRSWWDQGDFLAQIVTDPDAVGPIKTRLHLIDSSRLRSPFGRIGDPRLLLGVERNRMGRAMAYHITEEDWSQLGYGFGVHDYSGKTTRVRAADMIHMYQKVQAGQVRGFPWMASSLQTLEDLRGYDQAVLDAAKVAAMLAVVMHSSSDLIDPVEKPDPSTRLKSGAINYANAGWTPMMLNPTQPANNHVEYRSERHRELGRGVGMPLMQIRLDSSGHNYSSARFDGQNYGRSNEMLQALLERRIVKPTVVMVLQEAMLVGQLRPRSLEGVMWTWNWDQRPHVDPVKEAMAERLRMENRTLSPQRACRSGGVDFETIAREWKRANEILEANGLPPMLGPVPTDMAALAAWIQQEDAKDANDANEAASG